MPSELLPDGTNIEFDSDGDGSTPNLGIILAYSPADGEDKEGYLVACYYLVSLTDNITVLDEEDDDIRRMQPLIRGLMQKCGLDYHTVHELLNKGWQYVERRGEISRWEHPMWQLEDRKVAAPSMYEVLSKPIND